MVEHRRRLSRLKRIKWTSIMENREIKKSVHPVGASAEIDPPGTNAFMVCGRVRFVHGERTGYALRHKSAALALVRNCSGI
jgi:hypothetical protein